MTSRETLAEVKRLIAEICAVDVAVVRDDVRLIELGMDSVRAIELLVTLEETFGIAIPDEDVARLKTVADVAAHVERKVAARARGAAEGQASP